jgi:hypothetical protein
VDEATIEENFLVRYPAGTMWTANGDLLLIREVVDPGYAMPLQGGGLIVEEQTPLV